MVRLGMTRKHHGERISMYRPSMLSLVIQGDLLARPCICGVFVGSVQRWLVCWLGSTLAGIRRSEAGRSHRSPIPNQRRRTCSWISAYSLRFLSMIRSSRFALAVVSGLRTGNNLQKPVLPSCRSSSSSTYLRITGSSACLPIPTRTAVYPPIHFQPACMPLGWFSWWKSRLVSADSVVFCERE
jgi:hypothetical protein